MFEAEFWVAVAFVIFVGVLGYFQVHKRMVKSIDDRRDRIKAELEEARRLKAEAEALLASYQRKEFVERHTKMAESKISQAEAQALADVRSAAAEAAVAAAERILTHTVKGNVADDLIGKGIADLKGKLN